MSNIPDIQPGLGQPGQEVIFGFSSTDKHLEFEVFSGGTTTKSDFQLLVTGDFARELTLVRTRTETAEALMKTNISFSLNEIEPQITKGMFFVKNPYRTKH